MLEVLPTTEFCLLIKKEGGEEVSKCNQCGKCTAGCPASFVMDWGPRRIMRAIQLGLKEEALSSPTIWLCLFCFTCSARCPMGLDIPKIMDCLRHLALKEGIKPPIKKLYSYHRIFLGQIERLGRIYELGLAGVYTISSRRLPMQTGLLPKLFSRKKLVLRPDFKGNLARNIFSKVKEIKGA